MYRVVDQLFLTLVTHSVRTIELSLFHILNMDPSNNEDSLEPLCLEKCIFPVINTSFDGSKASEKLTPVHLESPDKLIQFCQHNHVTFSEIFQVAWCVLLRCYTGSDCPTFLLLENGSASGLCRDSCRSSLRSLDLSRNLEVEHLLRAFGSFNVSESRKTADMWVNSAITWNKTVHCSESVCHSVFQRREFC